MSSIPRNKEKDSESFHVKFRQRTEKKAFNSNTHTNRNILRASQSQNQKDLESDIGSYSIDIQLGSQSKINGKPAQPNLIDLLNDKNFNAENENIKKTFRILYEYAQKLESIIRSKEDAIVNLQHMNKYLYLAQNKRDDVLLELTSEVQKQKQIILIQQKRLDDIDKNGGVFNRTTGMSQLLSPNKGRGADRKIGFDWKRPSTCQKAIEKQYQSSTCQFTKNKNLPLNMPIDMQKKAHFYRKYSQQPERSISITMPKNDEKSESKTFGDWQKSSSIVANISETQDIKDDEVKHKTAKSDIRTSDPRHSNVPVIRTSNLISGYQSKKASMKPISNRTYRESCLLSKSTHRVIDDPTSRIFNNLMGDKKSSKTIFSLTESEATNKQLDNEPLMLLNSITKDQKVFNETIKNMDMSSGAHIRNAISEIITEYTYTFKLQLKMKKILHGVAGISGSYSTADAMEKIVNCICDLLFCERATVFILDKVNEILWSTVAKGGITIKIPYNKGIAGSVVVNNELINIKNAYNDARFDKSNDLKSGFKTKSIQTMPIHNNMGEIVGVVEAINKKSLMKSCDTYFSVVDEGVQKNVATFAGVILKNALMRDEQINLLDDLRKVLKIGIDLNMICDQPTQIKSAQNFIGKLFSVEKSKIFIKDFEKDMLYVVGLDGNRQYQPINVGLIGKCLREDIVMSVANPVDDPIYNRKIFF